jgi:sirohydrochlorin cobaltochelatase
VTLATSARADLRHNKGMPLRDAAVLLLGHGSTLNADSSAPTYQHGEEIRRRGIFAEVQVGFWKEEPNFRQALRQTECAIVYVVPNFISSGYFTEQVIPRELGFPGSISIVEGKHVHYCQPVGLSGESMTEVLLKRAREVVVQSNESCDPAKTCLFICGHGTSLNDNSTKIIYEQAEAIRAKGIYADCQPVLMEQRPFVKDWRTLTDCPDVVVVPFFISDGLHSFEDIPVLLGMTHNVREKGFTNPHRESGRRLWYSTAIGTGPEIADVIIDLVEQSERSLTEEVSTAPKIESAPALRDFVGAACSTGPWKIGQVFIERDHPGFALRHDEDCSIAAGELRPLKSLAELREMILRDEKGEFRPLRAAPNLQRGWIMMARDGCELMTFLDYLYPAAMANWSLQEQTVLPITPWRETAERQTGRFRVVREINDAGVQELAAEVCDRGCLKRRLWSPCAQTVEPKPNEIPLLCPEACNYFVSKARAKMKGTDDEPA